MINELEQLFKAKKYQECILLGKKIQQEIDDLNNEQIINLYHQMGTAHQELKQYTDAENYFYQLTEQFPESYYGILGLTDIANIKQDWQNTIAYGLKLQHQKPDIWQGYWRAGQAYKQLGQYEQAEQQFHLLTQNLPNEHRGYEGLVNVAEHQNNQEEIIKRVTVFREKFPNKWHSYWWFGKIYRELREYDKAEIEFNRLIELLPKKSSWL